ncbi:RNA 2'-phosphotransferase [Aureivirga sp. CE67]|uniref:RNA 2'-phosphotransferase n=1 Tax=Aureivirga sp. CE67 TaxID=1788983 RepID=UPI0018CA986B|nr:RNA 2'-phosphotransferase [Aureivirga sp. CE67]
MKPDKNNKRISKFLSLVLRHQPEKLHLEMDENGWVSVEDLISKMNKYQYKIDLSLLENVVATNDKKRFSFNTDKTKIRANQGHSIKINLGYEVKTPPLKLFHGTASKFTNSIYKEGLKKKNRHHVHLSKDIETAKKVGRRHGKLVVFELDTTKMVAENIQFFESENGVWLTDEVPVKFLQEIIRE